MQKMLKKTVVKNREVNAFLKERSELFRFIIDYASDAIIPVNIDGKIVFWNKAAEKMFGYTADEIIGKPITNIMPTNLQTQVEKPLVMGKNFETIGIRKDGSQFPVEFSYSIWNSKHGLFLTIIVRDITERKSMEEMLRASEEKYRSLFENAKDIIVILDSKGKIIDINKACESYGIKKEDAIGRNARSFIQEFFWPKMLKEIKRVILGEVVSGEIQMITSKGTVFAEYSGNPIKINNKIVGVQVIVRDITQRKKDEERIKQSEKMFRELFETSLDGIVMTDLNGYIVDCNKAYACMLGYSRNELKGINFKQLTPEKWQKIEEKIIKEHVLKRGFSNEYEKEYKRKDGTIFPVILRAWLIKGGDGKPKGIWAIVRDITEQKAIEKKREKYTRSLEGLVAQKSKELDEAQAKLLQSERLAAIGELAGMVGHDLRNPLMGIAGAVYYLRTNAESKLNDLEKRMLKIIENNVAYSNKIISDLQDYSKEINLELKETNVKRLLEESLSSIEIPNNIQIIDKTNKNHKITVDAAKMKRVFTNIIKNALDAMPNGGQLIISSKRTKTHMEIAFSDTGVGIPANVLEKIGKPLFTTKAKGMGFGLAICNRIMEAHEGKITVESVVGKGTTVKLVLPLAKKENSKDMISKHELSVTIAHS